MAFIIEKIKKRGLNSPGKEVKMIKGSEQIVPGVKRAVVIAATVFVLFLGAGITMLVWILR